MTASLSGCAGGQEPPKTTGTMQAILNSVETADTPDTQAEQTTGAEAEAAPDAPQSSESADSGVLPQTEPVPDHTGQTVDLTALSSTMVYAEVFSMTRFPEDYLGKTIKMRGQFTVYDNPTTDALYFTILIADATACCSQGIEFTLAGEHSYPADYPKAGSEITVIGQYQSYEKDGGRYYHLSDAQIVQE